MIKTTKDPSEGNGAGRESKREASQVTLSAIGDVSVAATEAVSRVGATSTRTRWLPILSFLFLVYVAGSLTAIYAHNSKPWVQVFVAPLVLVLIAVLAFWRRQVWKFRLKDRRFQEKTRENALNSLAHEAANGANAIRANLTAFREANPHAITGEHLQQVERALARIDAALEKWAAQPQDK